MFVVELCRRYSNRPDLLNPLVSVLDKIKNGISDTKPDLAPVRGNEPGVWRITDRLSPSDVGTLIESYRAGSTARLLAERYSVSTATVNACFVTMVCANSAHEWLPGVTDSSSDAPEGVGHVSKLKQAVTHRHAGLNLALVRSRSQP